ncbi:hypothetical protein HIM_00387 [Hirsutella minnesotensis 3608]|nr:hypothetical protein HIM_00387 [Hirsutella minnesotensis 3608]
MAARSCSDELDRRGTAQATPKGHNAVAEAKHRKFSKSNKIAHNDTRQNHEDSKDMNIKSVVEEVRTDLDRKQEREYNGETRHGRDARGEKESESPLPSDTLNAKKKSDEGDDETDNECPDDSFEPPDGGWRAWSQVLAAHLINAMTWGYAASFGVYQLHYAETLGRPGPGLPAAQISWIGSVQVFLSLAVCTISGRLSDAGHARATVAVGSALAVLGTLATSFASDYWQIFLAQGVCTGLGLGLAFMPAVSVTSSYFHRNRPLALSISAVGTSVGSIIFPATVHYLKDRIGFPWAVRCAALIALLFCVVAWLLLKPCLPPRKAGPWVEWAAFRELPYLLFALGVFLNFYILFFGFFYINSYARNIIGFSSLDSINILLITNALGIPTRPIAGYLANNYLGPINVFTLSTVALCIVIFSWVGVVTRTAMYAYSVVFGIFVSANQGTFIAALASLTKDPRKMGTRFGMVETMCSFASLAGPPTAGAIIDRSGGDYLGAQLWGGCVLAAAALLFAAARVAVTGWRWKVKI